MFLRGSKARWPNEFEQTMTMPNFDNWTWPKFETDKPSDKVSDMYTLVDS